MTSQNCLYINHRELLNVGIFPVCQQHTFSNTNQHSYNFSCYLGREITCMYGFWSQLHQNKKSIFTNKYIFKARSENGNSYFGFCITQTMHLRGWSIVALDCINHIYSVWNSVKQDQQQNIQSCHKDEPAKNPLPFQLLSNLQLCCASS